MVDASGRNREGGGGGEGRWERRVFIVLCLSRDLLDSEEEPFDPLGRETGGQLELSEGKRSLLGGEVPDGVWGQAPGSPGEPSRTQRERDGDFEWREGCAVMYVLERSQGLGSYPKLDFCLRFWGKIVNTKFGCFFFFFLQGVNKIVPSSLKSNRYFPQSECFPGVSSTHTHSVAPHMCHCINIMSIKITNSTVLNWWDKSINRNPRISFLCPNGYLLRPCWVLYVPLIWETSLEPWDTSCIYSDIY